VGVIKWVLALPFRLLALAIILPIKLTLGSLKLTAKTTFVTTRAAMRSSLISFAAGVGLGWFLSSTPTGRQLVDQVRDLVNGTPSGPVDDDQLAAQVRTELASSTRTWHLPQPEVSVSGGVVTLTGSVPHEVGRGDLAAAAGSVRGVVSVLNHVEVDEAPDSAAPAAVVDSAEEVSA
jgi:osmotically-inducible protein OsmY